MSSQHLAGPQLDHRELSQYAAERYAVLAALKEGRAGNHRPSRVRRLIMFAPQLVAVGNRSMSRRWS